MADQVHVNNILFLDIETVPQYPDHESVPDNWKLLWEQKARLVRREENDTPASIYSRAGIYAEFGRIICISCGYLAGTGNERKILIKSFYGHDEKTVLHEFSQMLTRWTADMPKYLCAHNGREFDFPYLCRRMIINNLPLPAALNNSGKKPWEVNYLDTMELWKFGDYKNFTSLNLLAHTLGIQTPKDDLDGSMVCDTYWKENDLDRIVTYCQKDVVTVAQVLLRMRGEPLLRPENIEYRK
jgi:uncharacterized protein YprB with RNaseH-like and TPR domain